MRLIKKALLSKITYIVLLCVTVTTLAAVLLFNALAFINAEKEETEISAPFVLSTDMRDLVEDFTFGITLSVHGDAEEIKVNKYTVEQLFTIKGIVLDEEDVVNVPLDTVLYDGMLLQIDNVRFETESEEVELPFGRVVNTSDELPENTEVTVSEGQKGLRKDTYEVKYVNGTLYSRRLTAQETVVEPVDEVITRGTRKPEPPAPSADYGKKNAYASAPASSDNAASSDLGVTDGTSSGGTFTAPDGTVYNYLYYVDVTATAYGDNVGSITATGRPVALGIIAVDPKVIPLYSKVYVIGDYGDYGVCDAQDVGGGIKGNRIDIYLKYESVCRQFGVRKMRAYVLEIPD